MKVQRSISKCVFILTLVTAAVALQLPFIRKRRGSDVLLEVPLIDGHNDLPFNLRTYAKNQLYRVNISGDLSSDPIWGNIRSSHTDLPRLRKGRLGAQFWSAYTECKSQYKDALKLTLEQIDVIKRLVNRYPDDLQLATSSQDIWDAFRNGKIASLIGVEGGHSIDSDLAVLRVLYHLGVRYMTLTHTCNTPWADASVVDDPKSGVPAEHNGLTSFGKQIVREMNRLGMMVDLSHVSHKTMIDAIQVSVAPVMFSHSSSFSVCPHHRNVRDDVLSMMHDNNGIVMVNFYSEYVNCNKTRKATIEDVVAHINHIRQVAGVDHVGIGGDYDGVPCTPKGLEDVSKYPDLFDRLANSHPGEPKWSREDLRKLAGLNLLRVLNQVEMVKQQLAANGVGPVETQVPRDDLKHNAECITDYYNIAES